MLGQLQGIVKNCAGQLKESPAGLPESAQSATHAVSPAPPYTGLSISIEEIGLNPNKPHAAALPLLANVKSTTFMHEAGHYFLKMRLDMATCMQAGDPSALGQCLCALMLHLAAAA